MSEAKEFIDFIVEIDGVNYYPTIEKNTDFINLMLLIELGDPIDLLAHQILTQLFSDENTSLFHYTQPPESIVVTKTFEDGQEKITTKQVVALTEAIKRLFMGRTGKGIADGLND